jgi:IMP dehydrogenase/GMP reductase
MLPLFAAPMAGVIDEYNFKKFNTNKINTIVPRTVSWNIKDTICRDTFVAIGLEELKTLIETGPSDPEQPEYICIDIANGHMQEMLNLCTTLKAFYPDSFIIIAGNIANPKTLYYYIKAGIDYVRLGIGSGNVCTTGANTGIYYPMYSLIKECYNIKTNYSKSNIKLIADGGFKNFDQIIKALAAGADYVMLGEIFAKSEEACGKILDLEVPYREYFGMSTKKAQQLMGISEDKLKTSEGIVKYVPIEYPLSKWIENFTHYLRSAMSYTDSRTLQEFIGKVRMEVISNQAFNSFYK